MLFPFNELLIMKVVVGILLIIAIIVAVLVLFAWLILLFVWIVFYRAGADYYPDIKDL